jgi:putative endopeptidase
MSAFKNLFLVSILFVVSCKKEAPLLSGVIKENMDTSINSGDNFHQFVNGTWLKKNKIPDDKASYGTFNMLDDQSKKEVKIIIEEAAKSNADEGTDEQKIGDFYNAFTDMKTRDVKGIAPLMDDFKKIDAISNYSQLARLFGYLGKMGVSTPLQFYISEDLKDPMQYSVSSWQGGLGLPEREYYLSKDKKMAAIREQYVVFIEKLLSMMGDTSFKSNSLKIMNLETMLATYHMKKEETRDPIKSYNKYRIDDIKKLLPNFDYKAMLASLEVDKEKSIIISQVDYTKKLDQIITNTPLETWKIYLKFGLMNAMASDLTSELNDINFNFYEKALSGTPKQEELWKRGVAAVNRSLGEVIGKVYVKKHFSPEAKERMNTLVKNLLDAYSESIKSLDWMGENTKKQALDKVSKFTVKIGYPDKWRDYSSLKIDKKDHYGNVKRSLEFEYNRMKNKLGKPVDKTEWGMTPQMVNAYYNPSMNEIVFPAAILQKPFFDMNADDAINYGGIGSVIGHEIGHGFDDQGSKFDGNGVMKDWWTKEDLTAFKTKTSALVTQYNSFKVFPDLSLNGEFTLGENIGDLGGLSIAIKAYKKSLNGQEAKKIDGFTGIQRVFIGWGQNWLHKSREEALRNSIASDPHSPPKYRVNGIVRNVPEFYDAFGIKPTDSLFLAPEKRVKIW